MDILIGIILVTLSFLFAYVSSVIISEEKQKERIPLFWEKEFWQKRKED